MTPRLCGWLAFLVLACACPAAAGDEGGLVRLVVGYTRIGAGAETLERRLGVAPVATVPQLRVHVLSVRSDRAEAVLAELRSSPIVLYAQRDTVVTALRTPNDELWPSQWSPRKTRAPQAWSLTTGSARVVVAVADTGVDSNQPDLRGKVVAGYDFVHGDSAATDDNGHGTAVAGVVAASGNNTIGVAGYCWQCRVMPVKVLGADGPGFSSTLAQGIVWATDHGARIVNASLGGPDSDAAVAGATQYAAAHGSLVVAAAGNDSSSVLEYPAALPGVLSVGATDRADHLYGFSNAGAAVAAPGENSTTGRGDEFVSFLGTSSATPVASGIAALCLTAAPETSPGQLVQALERTAVPVSAVAFGRVDAYSALRAVTPGLAPPKSTKAPKTRTIRGRLGESGRTVPLKVGGGMLRATVTVEPR